MIPLSLKWGGLCLYLAGGFSCSDGYAMRQLESTHSGRADRVPGAWKFQAPGRPIGEDPI